MKRILASFATLSLCGAAFGAATDLEGNLSERLDDVVGAGNTGLLIGDTKTKWYSTTSSSDIDLNGFEFELNTGSGNAQTYNGALTGPGSLKFVGRADASWWQSGDLRLGGSDANTPDSVLVAYGSIRLAKSAGVDALAGSITLGNANASNRVILAWNADHQINDASSITSAATPFELMMQGYSETFGTLAIDSRGYLDFGTGNSQVNFADSSAATWGAGDTLLVRNWAGSATNKVAFGSDSSGLTAGQVASVGFIDPAGFDAGLYRAQIKATGELIPFEKVEPINSPFDVSATAIEQRKSIYTVDGRAKLSGEETTLEDNTTISFFGDSITWQNGYISQIGSSLAAGDGTKDMDIQLINRGINGGGVLQVRDGSADAAYPNSSAQAAFADVIAADEADIAVVFIGINDVWWRGTSEEDFRSALNDIADQAAAAETKLVLASPTVRYEMPDGSNVNDEAIDAFTQIMREVAEDKDAEFVDLRAAYVAYEQNNNWELQLDGSLVFKESGLLTYDGVHPTAAGNALLADLISQGIFDAAAVPEPSTMGMLGVGAMMLAARPRR